MAAFLEPEYREPYDALQADPSSANKAKMLEAVRPTLESAVRQHGGDKNPLLMGHARKLALQSFTNYDPKKASLRTHLYGQLQGLKRLQRQQASMIYVPERIAQNRAGMDAASESLRHELGRDPTDAELSRHTGFSRSRMTKLRTYKPAISEGQWMQSQDTGEGVPNLPATSPLEENRSFWRELVYDDLPPLDQKIMEYAFGMGGRTPLSNQDIARKINRSPGLVSQRKARIQAILNQEESLSPF